MREPRWWSIAVAIGLTALGLSASATAQPARIAGSTSVKDAGYLRLVRSSGSLLIDEGRVRGTLPGTVNIRFVYNGNPSVSAQITISAHAGKVQARGSGRLSSPTSASPSFAGTLTITGGSGRYAHARGSGKMFGVFYRRSYAITVQTEGTLHY
ncbi:MAG TPA: autotransporter [Solirubrobacteraceae bacterium]|nr:autotransporter [Solirubrobacteraceae bacterium]